MHVQGLATWSWGLSCLRGTGDVKGKDNGAMACSLIQKDGAGQLPRHCVAF